MMEPKVIGEINSLNLKSFCETYKISVTEAEGLVSLKYTPDSDMSNEFVKQCRGLIITATFPHKVVCWPYDKFFNSDEEHAAKIDWKNASVLEKVDGSLILMYYDKIVHAWRVGTSGHPTAGGSYNGSSETFSDAFWDKFRDKNLKLPDDKGLWLFFELCAPDNRIVVKYTEDRIILHGGRNSRTGEELDYTSLAEIANQIGCELIGKYSISNDITAIKALANSFDPLANEGLIVVDTSFNRIKVKNLRYVHIHHLRGARTSRAIIELWKTGEYIEVLAHFPEFISDFRSVIDKIENKMDELFGIWIKQKKISDRKSFALSVKNIPMSSILFKLFSKKDKLKDDIDEYFYLVEEMRKSSTNSILEALDEK